MLSHPVTLADGEPHSNPEPITQSEPNRNPFALTDPRRWRWRGHAQPA
ncbi:MAG TPA: hypothetical protein VIA06_07630 [Candidatus Dormibacteraeota bacterium]|nr:hypothetical protein [Candidatus Dormibacteraeota bacterium]